MPYLGRVDNDDEFPWKGSNKSEIEKDEDTESKYPYGTILYIIIYITAKTKLLK